MDELKRIGKAKLLELGEYWQSQSETLTIGEKLLREMRGFD